MGKNYLQELLNIDAENTYRMFIVDYLISNPDRHSLNWGLFYNCDTMQILGLHPLFDHNNAFDTGVMQRVDGGNSHFYSNKTMLDVARMAKNRCNFRCNVKRRDFMYREHYKSFLSRIKHLEGV